MWQLRHLYVSLRQPKTIEDMWKTRYVHISKDTFLRIDSLLFLQNVEEVLLDVKYAALHVRLRCIYDLTHQVESSW